VSGEVPSAGADASVSVSAALLEVFCREALAAAGAREDTASAATRAMMHASRLGVDSHGVRLLDHYVAVISGGRVNPRPRLGLVSETGAVAALDADDAHGALAASPP
jgi:LDH2 family malate/lactate/ureidoglycolate dehydrogenase